MKHSRTASHVEKLERERDQVCRELIRLREALKSEVDGDVGEGDPELVERDMVMSLIHEQERKLQALDDALQHARRGAYGICERCGQPIDPARLEAIPETTFCLKCKMIVEKENRSRTFASV